MGNKLESNEKKPKKPFLFKLGIGFLALSVLCWLIAAIVLLMPFSLGMKASMITGSLVAGEILFWVGALFAGKEVVSKYRSYLNPKNWRKKGERKKHEE